eukprot:4687622-Pyramimonas_sp.AAC.1
MDKHKEVYTVEMVFEGKALAAFSEKPMQVLNTAAKKDQVDINMRKATLEVTAMVAEAKLAEVSNWVHNEVYQAALRKDGIKPMKMRWRLIMNDEGK